MTIITIKFLKDCNIEENIINFFKINFPVSKFPNGLDLSKVTITGHYNTYFNCFKNLPTLEYDKYGKVIKQKLIDGDCITLEYDKYDRIIKSIYDDGLCISLEYDDNGNLIGEKHFNEDNYLRIFKYDSLNRLIKEENFYGGWVFYEYTERGEISKEVHSNGASVLYEYDKRSNCIQEKYSNGITYNHIYKYDTQGRVIQISGCYISYPD